MDVFTKTSSDFSTRHIKKPAQGLEYNLSLIRAALLKRRMAAQRAHHHSDEEQHEQNFSQHPRMPRQCRQNRERQRKG